MNQDRKEAIASRVKIAAHTQSIGCHGSYDSPDRKVLNEYIHRFNYPAFSANKAVGPSKKAPKDRLRARLATYVEVYKEDFTGPINKQKVVKLMRIERTRNEKATLGGELFRFEKVAAFKGLKKKASS